MTHPEAEGDGSFLPPKPTPPLPNDCCGSGNLAIQSGWNRGVNPLVSVWL